jgi:prepilin-type N-terminal cleavage/methylation domain-containing protein
MGFRIVKLEKSNGIPGLAEESNTRFDWYLISGGSNMLNKNANQKGFTLIEAAVAIAVVAILSGIIIPLVVKNLRDAQVARARNDVQVIAAAIASQMKDTGGRPSAAGINGSTGAGNVNWWSGASEIGPVAGTANNSFTNLFTLSTTNPAANNTPLQALFGFPAATTMNSEFGYKGPYLGTDVALKTDPWGDSYYILGYSAASQASNGPIWVFSVGPNKVTTLPAYAGATGYAQTWQTNANAADDIVVRVN